MYIFKNAIISITRNKGRNLLIGLIVLVIASAASIALAIRNSASSLINAYENQYEVTASLGINREAMRGEMKFDKGSSKEDREDIKENMNDIFSSASNITIEDIEKYGDSEYVKSYYYQISVGVNSDDIEVVSMSSNSENNENNFKGHMTPGRENFQNMATSDFTLVGYSSISAMSEFVDGKYTITSGEVSNDMKSKSCVINSELAALNSIEVGDEITFVDPDDEDNEITLTVFGIFEEESDTNDMMGMFSTSANIIITNSTVVNTLTDENEDMKKTITPTFILTDKDVIDKFSEELTTKGMSEYLSVSTNLDMVDSATSTISNVKTFATTFLIITLIIGAVILFVINMINIRERKYEIGVLRTIGMKKSKLTLQFVSELLIVAMVFLLVGSGIGALCSVPVSNYLLESEISSSSSKKENINKNFGANVPLGSNQDVPGGINNNMMDKVNGVVDVQAFDSIDAVVDMKVMLELLGIGIILTLISSSASMISIQKFSPLTILKERS